MSRPSERFARQLCAPRALRSRTRRPRLVVQTLEDRTNPAQIPVTSLLDNGAAGTLRAAINQANSTPEADEIVFNPGLFATPQTINLAQGALPTILDAGGDLTITGPGVAKLTVNAGGTSQVFDSFAKHLTLTGFTVANGKGINANGGGLIALNSVTLDRMAFTANSVTGAGFSAGSGGAIAIRSSGALTVRNTTISGNTATQSGGGIYFFSGGSLLLVNSTISGNATTTTTADNYGGGGVYFFGTTSGFTIANSTIFNNTSKSSGGGILLNGNGTIQILNSTIVGNTATNANAGQGGGGVAVVGGSGAILVSNSVVSGNAGPTGPDILSSNTVTVNYSALGSNSGAGFTLTGANNQTGLSPAALGLPATPTVANGGLTATFAPAAGSPLIDAGSNNLVPAGLTTDQRGIGFLRFFPSRVDIGSVEVQTVGQPVAETAPPPVTAPTVGAYTFDVTFEDPAGSNNGIRAADLFNMNTVVRVTGPNGFNQLATYVGPAALSDGTPLTVTYSISPPGGWDVSEDGTYTVSVEPSTVHDLDNNLIAGGPIGAINVFIPRTLHVTSAADSGTGSLRDALTQAVAIGSDDTIVFDSPFFDTPRTIDLQSALPFLTPASGALDIVGPGTALLTVQRSSAAGTPNFRIFESDGAALSLSNFTVSGGVSAAAGVAGFGATTLEHMVVTGNHAAGIAGGLFFGPGQTATISNSTVSNNTSTSVGGGIIVATGASLTLADSTVSNNSAVGGGGGIFVNDYGSLTVVNSTISGNSTTGPGGGIYGRIGTSITVQDSTVSGNHSTTTGGGIDLRYYGSLTVEGSTISGNSATTSGGGIALQFGGSVAVGDSTISGNSTSSAANNNGGGGIFAYYPTGPIVLQNTTIANNVSASSGGAVMVRVFYGTMQVTSCTISGNSAANTSAGQGGGGVAVLDFSTTYSSTGTVTIQNSVISGNSNTRGRDLITGTQVLVNANYSLIFDQNGFTLSATSAGNLLGIDPLLGPLQDNGGPTQTMAPQANSPLLDAGDNSLVPAGVTADQRGLDRLDPSTGLVDIGAVEAQAATVTINLDPAQPAFTNNPAAVVFDVVFDQPVTGFDGTAVGIDLTGSDPTTGPLKATVTRVTPTTYTVTVTALTGNIGDGQVVASVLAGTATVGVNATGQGNEPSPGAATVTVDTMAPTATVTPAAGQRDPTNDPAIRFLVEFGEDVTGFDEADVVLTSTGGDTLTPTVSPGPDPNSFFVDVGGVTTAGTITAAVRAGAVQDNAGNASVAGSGHVLFDNVAPTVAVSLSAGQAASTGGGTATTLSFDVVFSEPVDFTAADVDLAGSPPGTHIQAINGTGPAYTVLVTGMTGGGTVTFQIDANSVADPAGNTNPAASSASVTFVHSGTVQFSSPTYAIDEEGEPTLSVIVTRTDGSDGPLDVPYTITDGTAHAGVDYFVPVGGMTGTLHWDAGDASPKPITIQIRDDGVRDGGPPEADSAFTVGLTPPALAGVLGTPASATVTIREQAAIVFSDPVFNAAEADPLPPNPNPSPVPTTATITVKRLFGSHGAVTANYAVTDGTAHLGSDYGPASGTGTLTWLDGDTADKTFTIPITDDTLSEGRETINLSLSLAPGQNAVLGAQATAVVAIAHSDGKAGGTPFLEGGPTALLSDKVTPKLAGRVGTLTYYLTDGVGPISEMVLDGTDASKSVVTLTVTKPRGGTGDGRAQIGEITQVNGTGVKAMSLGKADLVGAGIDVAGYLGALTIGDVKNGADIAVHGAPPLKPTTSGTKITAGRVLGTAADPSDITFDDPGGRGRLASLSAVSVGAGTITAATVGTITTKGKAKTKAAAAIPGDFASDLTVTGPSLTTRTPALTSLTLNTGSVPAGVDIKAPTIGTIKVTKGDFAGNIIASGAGIDSDPRKIIPALKTFFVGGTVTGSTIQLGSAVGTTGNVGSVSVGGFVNSRLFAGDDGTASFNLNSTVGTFTVRAVKGLTNQFAQSFVIAANFKTVSLATADTATGPDFGFEFDNSFGTLTLVKTAAGKKTYDHNLGGTQQIDGHLFVTKAP